MMTTGQAADHCSITVGTLRNLRCLGRFPAPAVIGRPNLYEKQALDKWIERRDAIHGLRSFPWAELPTRRLRKILAEARG